MLPDHIKQILLDRYDPDDIISVLGLDTEELIELLEDYISDNLDKFELD